VNAHLSARRIALAVLLVALAVALVLLAHDTWRWGRAVSDGDRRAAVEQVGPDTWSASTVLPSSVVRGVLGVNDDLDYRRTVASAIREIILAPTAQGASAKQAVVVETALARLSQTDPNPVRASRAADYLGLLLYAERNNPQNVISPYQNAKDAASGKTRDDTPEEKARVEFELAVRLDPANDDAKRHLELLLHQVVPPSERISPRPGSGEQLGSKGSGSRPAGYGY
jgi:hypothetical protein